MPGMASTEKVLNESLNSSCIVETLGLGLFQHSLFGLVHMLLKRRTTIVTSASIPNTMG